MLNEGILYCKALSKVVCPVETRSFADTTSIGKDFWYYLPVFLILLLQFPVMLGPSSDKTTFIIEAVVAFSTLENQCN
jgi:hypothetical protein